MLQGSEAWVEVGWGVGEWGVGGWGGGEGEGKGFVCGGHEVLMAVASGR